MADLPVGQAIFTVRTSRGLSQEKLAELSGLARNTIARLESGQRMPSLETFVCVADAMGVEPYKLLKFARKLQTQLEDPAVQA
jgi:transcriptional regulator with XRE-family HTH domain